MRDISSGCIWLFVGPLTQPNLEILLTTLSTPGSSHVRNYLQQNNPHHLRFYPTKQRTNHKMKTDSGGNNDPSGDSARPAGVIRVESQSRTRSVSGLGLLTGELSSYATYANWGSPTLGLPQSSPGRGIYSSVITRLHFPHFYIYKKVEKKKLFLYKTYHIWYFSCHRLEVRILIFVAT